MSKEMQMKISLVLARHGAGPDPVSCAVCGSPVAQPGGWSIGRELEAADPVCDGCCARHAPGLLAAREIAWRLDDVVRPGHSGAEPMTLDVALHRLGVVLEAADVVLGGSADRATSLQAWVARSRRSEAGARDEEAVAMQATAPRASAIGATSAATSSRAASQQRRVRPAESDEQRRRGLARDELLAALDGMNGSAPTPRETERLMAIAGRAFEAKTAAARLARALARLATAGAETHSNS